MHGFYQVVGDLLKPTREYFIDKFNINKNGFWHRLCQIITVFILVDFAWIFFRANTFSDAIGIIKNMFVFNPWVLFDGSLYNLGLDQKDFIVGILAIFVLIIVSLLRRNTRLISLIGNQNIIVRWVFYFTFLYSILIFGIYGPGYEAQQFIYFQF